MADPRNYKWLHDYLSPEEGHFHGLDTILYTKQTKYQRMEIMRTKSYGDCLVLDGKMQSSEVDEFIYHETLVHPALLTHPNPKRVFVVGGGEGATLREILRHKSVEYVLMVDIDQEVVESCMEHLPAWHKGAFKDPRVELRYLDARKYLEETKDTYDSIVIDISEPVEEGPAYLLYTKEFYNIVFNRLTKSGTISLQAGTTSANALLNFSAVYQTLKTVFPVVSPYQASIPSFGLPWGFAMASKDVNPQTLSPAAVDQMIQARIKGELKYFNGELHQGHYLLPKHIRQTIEKADRIIEDNTPLFTYN